MSLRAPSVLGLVTTLQQQGLTYAQLLEFVMACQQRHTGQVRFHLAQGHIRMIEVHTRAPEATRLRHD